VSKVSNPQEIRESEERLRFETLLIELSSRFINVPALHSSELISAQEKLFGA
jgi:hypothetical protein